MVGTSCFLVDFLSKKTKREILGKISRKYSNNGTTIFTKRDGFA